MLSVSRSCTAHTPAMMRVLRAAATLVICAAGAAGYSSGAGGCAMPGHGSSGSASTSITAPSSAAAGSTVTVTLSGSSFKGFLLKASGGATFSSSLPSGTKAKTCSGYSSVTHSSGMSKTSLSFSLVMPSSGTVQLSGVGVTAYSAYHNLAARSITVPSPPPPPVVDCAGSWGGWTGHGRCCPPRIPALPLDDAQHT